MRKWKIAVVGLVLALGVAQLIQPERTNPPADPQFSFAALVRPPERVTQILGRSCGDCHSSQTVWPWYSKVSPVSWLIAGDVTEGRSKLNFSQWNIYSPEMSRLRIKAVCAQVKSGDMPPWYYKPMHPGASLSAEDVAAICAL